MTPRDLSTLAFLDAHPRIAELVERSSERPEYRPIGWYVIEAARDALLARELQSGAALRAVPSSGGCSCLSPTSMVEADRRRYNDYDAASILVLKPRCSDTGRLCTECDCGLGLCKSLFMRASTAQPTRGR